MACSPYRREQIADMAAGRLGGDPAANLLAHVAECEPCSAEFDLVADLARAAPEARTPARVLAFERPLLALAAALLVGLLLWQPWASAESFADLAQTSPITAPEALLRGEPGERGEAFRSGMQAYAAGDYARAVRALAAVAEQRPDDALPQLYLGIARLQTDEVALATAPLAAAAEHGTGLVQERGLWFLANAHLRLEQPDPARDALERLRALDGDYAANADALLRRLADR